MTTMTDSILAPARRPESLKNLDRDPVPVTLLTGFLGAGKTTLLNRILNGDHGLRVGVLVNDFGAINIDADLIEGVEENTISLSNGCVCCEIRDDLVNSIELLLVRVNEIDYIILEASGVADPESVVMTFMEPRYQGLLYLDSVTCVVDAEGIFAHQDNLQLTMLKLRQIGFADLVILNKIDLVGSENVAIIKEWIASTLNRVRIVEANHCDVPLEILLAVGRFNSAQMTFQDESGEPVTTEHVFDRWSFETKRPLSLEALTKMVKKKLPGNIYRCKGIVYTTEHPEQRVILQAVGRRSDILLEERWGARAPLTKIVAIGAPDSINNDELTALFEACVADPITLQ